MSLSSPTPTSSSTSLSKPGGTATNVLALTTPFVQKPDCESIWALSHVSSYEDDGHLTSVAFLASDADDERFTSCQPPGWASVVPASRFSFSPAVCPSNWTYYDMASTTNAGTTFTTAYCCASEFYPRSYYLDPPYLATGVPCWRDARAGDVSSLLAQAHEAWHISWAASDTSTLSLALPEITSGMHVYSWVPGETISPGAYDGESNHHESNNHDGPQCCVVFHRVKKTERRERWLAEHELTTNVVDSQGK
ncbi:hypothetical protein O988_09293 [Pseudogymnoascus sp. VKM F-3808]|nr:hypothetical protein O988_09293 [Pseudogymnoascus sp. VKM F-3808]